MDDKSSGLFSRKSEPSVDFIRALGTRRSSLPAHGLVQPRRSLDRFIPRRRGSDFDCASFLLSSPDTSQNESVFFSSLDVSALATESPRRRGSVKRSNTQNCIGSDAPRIFAFSSKESLNVHTPPKSSLTDFYRRFEDLELSLSPKESPKRNLPQHPERVLDMPNIKDDFYSNVMDWSSTDNIALAIGNEVHCWNSANDSNSVIHQGLHEDGSQLEVHSVAWCPRGKTLAIGTAAGDVQLYSVKHKRTTQIHQQSMEGLCSHGGETDVVAWDKTGKDVYSCHKCGCVHCVNAKTHKITTLDVKVPRGSSGVVVSPDNKYLVIGGNTGVIEVWGIREEKVIQSIEGHRTASKALCWIPWQQSVIISGGGSGDGCIKMWNAKKGELLTEVNTCSQVCCMVLAPEHRELLTGHGHQCTDIILWNLPSLTLIGRLSYHTARVLQIALDPDQQTLASLGADESLVIWKCFDSACRTEKRRSSCPLPCASPLLSSIR